MARKKKKENELLFFIRLTLLVCVALSIVGVSINPDTFLIVFIIILTISLFGVFLRTPYMRGKIGEWRISLLLKNVTKDYDSKVINDVVIEVEGKSSQIDHVLIDRSGIYVIETKNYSGRIYGSYDDKNWTQVLVFGHRKNKLYNPILQNKVHMYRLMEVLGIKNNIHSLVVFVKSNIEYINADEVYTPRTLKKYIKKHIDEEILSEEEVLSLFNKLNDYKENPVKTNKEHIKGIQEMRKNIYENICPNCKIPLVVRVSKNGNHFYGCSNYPKCKFTKKV